MAQHPGDHEEGVDLREAFDEIDATLAGKAIHHLVCEGAELVPPAAQGARSEGGRRQAAEQMVFATLTALEGRTLAGFEHAFVVLAGREHPFVLEGGRQCGLTQDQPSRLAREGHLDDRTLFAQSMKPCVHLGAGKAQLGRFVGSKL